MRGVADKCKKFASDFSSSEWGQAIGLLHDIGKYSDDFQRYLKLAIKSPESVRRGEVDHSSAGAIFANNKNMPVVDYVIAGHHSGLPNFDKLSYRIGKIDEFKKISGRLPDTVNSVRRAIPPQGLNPKSLNMWARLLFSSLVDADWLDTETFCSGSRKIYYDDIQTLLFRLNSYMSKLSEEVLPNALNQDRKEIFDKCSEIGKTGEGNFFSLTVPTGYGKTLSSIAFALNYALKHDKKRVIVAIPYTGIIAQTAAKFREIFGENNVLEHHSGIDFFDTTTVSQSARFASENWDIPIIITTNVRFFEGFYASSTSKCRRLHNVCQSVVVLDEAQMLPPEFLSPILEGIKELSDLAGTSFLFCTATQPAFSGKIGSGINSFASPLPKIIEIVDNYRELFSKKPRTVISISQEPYSFDTFAKHLKERECSWLCITNTRLRAKEIGNRIPEAYHLSRSMCSAHIEDISCKVKELLKNGKIVHLVSTQLIEAGVDIDFPEVYREYAGLDSIVQAAGRCNREGKLELGKVEVFKLLGVRDIGFIGKGESAFSELLTINDADSRLDSPENISKYFRLFYKAVGNFDKANIKGKLWSCVNGNKLRFDFEDAAREFKLISDEDTDSVYVHYIRESKEDEVERILCAIQNGLPAYIAVRKLQPYSIQIRKSELKLLKRLGAISEINGLNILIDESFYNCKYGLIVNNNFNNDNLIA